MPLPTIDRAIKFTAMYALLVASFSLMTPYEASAGTDRIEGNFTVGQLLMDGWKPIESFPVIKSRGGDAYSRGVIIFEKGGKYAICSNIGVDSTEIYADCGMIKATKASK